MTKKQNDPLLLNDPVEKLNGIGPKRATALNRCGFFSIKDLLDNFPKRYLDKSKSTPITDFVDGEYLNLYASITDIKNTGKKLEISVSDNSGSVKLIWFAGIRFIVNKFNLGNLLQISGKVAIFGNYFQFTHPDIRFLSLGDKKEEGIFPVYTIPEEFKKFRLDNKTLSSAVNFAFKGLRKNLPDLLPADIVSKFNYPSPSEAYYRIHFPESYDFLEIESAKERFKFLEAWLLAKHNEELRISSKQDSTPYFLESKLRARILDKVGFKLTNAQNRVLTEIELDITSPFSMNRLLFGDVGSGKTVIALLASVAMAKSKVQSVLLVPSSILALQHFINFTNILKGLELNIALLTAATIKKEKEQILSNLKSGIIDILIGTHSVFSENVEFKDLGLAIIDEQHKFGVKQRIKLAEKGKNPNILNISATPIPRTLAISIFGNMDISVIDELPPGRLPVLTRRIGQEKKDSMIDFLVSKINNGGRAFIVLPLVEESEKLKEVNSLNNYVTYIKNHKATKDINIEFVHGKMDSDSKELAIEDFRSGKSPILIATTVVEVGIDIPDADVLIVENPERFGLAQLHQLRGRVGRGTKESFCFLSLPKSISPEAYERLGKFCEINDGFKLAEFDLSNRGMGDYYGTRQSGRDAFKYLDFFLDIDIIKKAREEYLIYSKSNNLL